MGCACLADRGGAGGGQVYAGAVYLSCVLLLCRVCRVPDIFSLVCVCEALREFVSCCVEFV